MRSYFQDQALLLQGGLLTSTMLRRYIFTLIFSLLAFVLLAQSASKETRRPLLEVLQALEQHYQVKFAYDQAAIANEKAIMPTLNLASLETALTQVFTGSSLVFRQVAPGQVLIRPAKLEPVINEPALLTVQGRVLDGWTGEALPYANLYTSVNEGTTTDEEGNFSMKLRSGDILTCQYVGYQSQQLAPTADRHNTTIKLTPQIQKLAPIVIEERVDPVQQVPRRDGLLLSGRGLSDLPPFVAGSDVLRSLQLLPGIDATDDLSATLQVRGGNGDESLVQLDGMTLYNVTHFYGIFSLVNADAIGRVSTYKNAFPAEFGGRTSAVVDLVTPDGLSWSKPGAALEANLLTTQAALKLPLGPQMSAMLAGRITNTNLAGTSLFGALEEQQVVSTLPAFDSRRPAAREITAFQPDFGFYDFTGKWQWAISPATQLSATYFSGADGLDYDFERSIFPNPFRKDIYRQETYRENADWSNQGASLRWKQEWSPYWTSQLTLAQSSYHNESEIGTSFSRIDRNQQTREVTYLNNQVNQVAGKEALALMTWRPDNRNELRFGVQGINQAIDVRISQDSVTPLNSKDQAWQHAIFIQHRGTYGPWNTDIGLRSNTYQGTTFLSPRLFLSLEVAPSLFIKGSWGRYYQFLRQLTFEDRYGRSYQYWVLHNDRFPYMQSDLTMLGINLRKKEWEVDVEFFEKRMDGVLEQALTQPSIPTVDGMPIRSAYRLFLGTGRSIGMDVLLRKTQGTFTGWLAYTLSKTTQSFPAVFRGADFAAPTDRRHQLKLIGQYHPGRWDFSATYIFASGHPYTDLSGFLSNTLSREDVNPQDRISYLEDYHRIDLAGSYHLPLGRAEGEIGISLYNLLDRINVKYRQYIYSLPTNTGTNLPIQNTVLGSELQMLGFTPNVRLRVTF